MTAADGTLQRHWPVPLAVHRFERAAEVNPLLARVFGAMRATDAAARPGHFYASGDDLLQRVQVPEFHALVQFIVQAIQTTAQQANAGLWPGGRHDLQLELKALQRKTDTTFLLVTHDQDEAIAVSDRILVMADGAIVQDGTAEEVWDRPVSRFVASFLGRANLLEARRESEQWVTTAVGSLRVPRDAAWQQGTLAIRPEDIEIRPEAPGQNGLSGVVAVRLFRGDHWELSVDCGPLSLRVLTETDAWYEAGQQVWLELPCDDIQVLRD